MKTFEVGNKVKIIKNTSGRSIYDEYIGMVGYIEDIFVDSDYPYSIYSRPKGKGEYLHWWKASELELVKKKVKTIRPGAGLVRGSLAPKPTKEKKGYFMGEYGTCSVCGQKTCFCPERQSNGDWKETKVKKSNTLTQSERKTLKKLGELLIRVSQII
jgi:hypothetical protein